MLTYLNFVEEERHEDLLAGQRKKESRQEIYQAPRPVDVSDDWRCDGWNAAIVFVWSFPCGLTGSPVS